MPQQAGGPARPPQKPAVAFTVLGPVGARGGDGRPLGLKGPMHRAVLARLLIARGKVVPLEWLVDDLWEDPPPRAVGTIRTFVSTLRRALEPDRPPRAPARLLVTAGPGYALRPAPDAVDAWRFESAVRGAGELLDAGRPGPAVRCVDEALALWRGPAYAEWAGADWARAEAARLDGLRLLAVERRAAGSLALGLTDDVVPDLEAQVGEHPWREESWRLLALALYRAGRQGDALAALRRARRILVTELGVDPGPELRRLEAGVLGQEPGLLAPGPGAARVAASDGFVGRGRELAVLDEAAGRVGHAGLAAGRGGLVLVSGEAGAGKTALAERLTARLAARGWTTAWGRCPEHEGVPAAWPWTTILTELAAGPWPTTAGADGGVGERGAAGAVPGGAGQRPASAGVAPAAAGEAPALAGEASAAAKEPSALAGQPPASAGESPALAGQSSAPAGESPAFAGQSPAAAGESPAPAGEAPALAGRPLTPAGQPPASAGESPARAGQPPALAGETPALAGQASAAAKEPSTLAGQPPASAGESPAFAGQPPAPAGKAPAPAGKVPAVAGQPPAPAGEPPAPAGEAPAPDAPFQRRRALGELLRGVVARERTPLLLVLDDLQWADDETLECLESLGSSASAGVLVVGTYRETDVPARLRAFLGRVARDEPVRVVLGGLGEDDVATLVRTVAGPRVAADAVRAVHARSGGNPFFVRELARLCATDGRAALSGVPIGVRDVIRHRLGALDEEARTVLRQASVIGPEADLDLLIPLAGGNEDAVVHAVETALRHGFLDELGPDRVRFAHALVRETLYEDISRARRARWHTALAEAIETLRPHDVDALADHYLRAGTRATAARAVHHARLAARRAEQDAAPHRAARLWRAALGAHDRLGGEHARERLGLVMGLVRALAVTGGLAEAGRHRSDALADAERTGDPELTAQVIGAFDVPANWTRNDDEALSRRIVDAAERTLLALPEGDDAARCRLLATIAMELRGSTGPRGRDAAAEAEALARGLGPGPGHDPALLAFALNARFMHSFERAGRSAERLRIGQELVDIAGGAGGGDGSLVAFHVLGQLMCLQAHCARAEFGAADARSEAADRLAERYDLPLVGVFTEWYAALKQAVSGRTEEARAAYVAAAARLPETGMTGLEEGLLPLALLSLRGGEGREGQPLGGAGHFGPYGPWCRPVGAIAPADLPPSPPDLLLEARLCLHARAAVAAGDDPVLMERLYRQLRPACGELAGAGSGLVSFGPVDRYAGDLAAALGRGADAARHHERARALESRLRDVR